VRDSLTATYFRSLAVRCLTAARDSYDRRAIDEFRKLADEFAEKADELEQPLLMLGTSKPQAPERQR
jgi:hypothetical protein